MVPELLLASDAARLLGLSASRVRQLDPVLRPIRTSPRGIRLYPAHRLWRYAGARDAARACGGRR